jgi:hypothetical protein
VDGGSFCLIKVSGIHGEGLILRNGFCKSIKENSMSNMNNKAILDMVQAIADAFTAGYKMGNSDGQQARFNLEARFEEYIEQYNRAEQEKNSK